MGRTETVLAKDTSKSGAATGPAGQRKPPIIDLSAAEVRKSDVPPNEGGGKIQPEPPPRQPEAPAAEPVIPSAFATTADRDRKARADLEREPKAGAGTARRGPGFAALLLAAIVGGLLAAALMFALDRALAPAQQAGAPDLTADVAALRSDVEALREMSAAQGAPDLAPLQGQIAALEQALGELRSEEPGTADFTSAMQEVQTRLAELESRAGQAAGEADPVLQSQVTELAALVEAVPEQLATLASELEETRAQLDETSAKAETALAIGPAVAADALAEALQSGQPFAGELEALDGLGLDENVLAELAPHAEAGLPTLAALRAGFEAAIEGIALRPPLPEETGTVERLLQSARGLVEVRPVNPVAGDEPAAIVARIRGALDAGDLATALAEWNALPEDAKANSADWARAAEAREAADALVARLRAQALSRLGGQG
jgi:hypothetical protein